MKVESDQFDTGEMKGYQVIVLDRGDLPLWRNAKRVYPEVFYSANISPDVEIGHQFCDAAELTLWQAIEMRVAQPVVPHMGYCGVWGFS